jgi:amino acid adenylation domain-containing protein
MAAAQPASFQLIRAVAINGLLDHSRLATAVARIVEEHEILRTTFRVLPGTNVPVQLIHPSGSVTLDQRMLTPGQGANGHAASHALEALHDEPLDIQQGPTARFVLFEDSPDRHLLALAASALCTDLEGIDKALEAVMHAYVQPTTPAEDVVQYADLAEWQHSLLTDDDAQEGIRFWEATGFLDQTPPALPFALARDAAPFTPRVVRLELPRESLAAARALADQLGVTLTAVGLAAWECAMWRFSGQETFVLGVSCHGRTYEELGQALGLFARDLPKVASVDAQTTFADLITRNDASLSALYEHQEYFSWSHIENVPDRWVRHYFPVSFRLEERQWHLVTDQLRIVPAHSIGSGERFVLRADITVQEDQWHLDLHFDASHLRDRDVARMGRVYSTLLASGVENPQLPIASLEVVRDVSEVLEELTFTSTPASPGVRIHDLFEGQLRSTPDAVAVISGQQHVTYGELGARVHRLAQTLKNVGVRPETPVGLLVHRSIDMVAGILGILEAGGAYVPLDPAYPPERLTFMLEDAGAPVVLTTRELAGRFTLPTQHVVHIDEAYHDLDEAASPTDDALAADSLAYIIYTSGSTGTPKGVEVTHANLVQSTVIRDAIYDAAPGRFLLLSSFSFDSSVAGIFWTMCSGGTLVLPAEGAERDINALADLIEQHQVTHTLCLPSLYQLLLDHAARQIQSLTTVIVAGEACRPELVTTHHRALPGAALFNEYGPTEGTVWSSVHRCEPDRRGPVPIGRPLPNTQAYVVDQLGRPLPNGVPGELYIGGLGITRGYRNQPDLTNERFVPDTFSPEAGKRLYRTGDLARYLSDGALEFLGRVDHQVKIRGYRIELGEIEDRLARHAGVREVAVIAREDVPGDKRLVAYIAPAADAPSTEDLLAVLRSELPEYMIPTAVVRMDHLPKTATGKVDRGALPAPQLGAGAGTEFVAPRTALEDVLAALWGEVLHIDAVGVQDDFLKLGGHSLLVTQLVARVRETLSVDIPLRVVFEKPTVALMAEYLLAQSNGHDLERTAEVIAEVARMSDEGVAAELAQSSHQT